jgi:cytidine deaminase
MAENLEVKSTFMVYDDINGLPLGYKELVEAAQKIADNAYAPYSKFKVGAAVLTDENQIITGSNQENAAYPSGLCAERVALFYTSANYHNKHIQAIAIVAKKDNIWKVAMPCGACRQVIREYETKQEQPVKIIMAYNDGKYIIANGAEDLLPLSFTKTDL